MDRIFWENVGSAVAKGLKVTGQYTVKGCVAVAKGTTVAAKVTGQAFKEEWQRQNQK